ncbi:MAG: chemotaxis protein CheW [Gemmatimonadaceae bacterium]
MTRQLLVVEAAGRLYALPSEFVREITNMLPATRIPGAADDVRGLVNLRGQLFAVLDLAHRVSGTASAASEPDVVVLSAEGKTLGVLVDDVREVIALDESASEGLETQGVKGGLVAGVGHFGEAVVIEVDVKELVRQSLA